MKKILLSIFLSSFICNAQISVNAIYKKDLGKYEALKNNENSNMEISRKKYHMLSNEVLKKVRFQFKTNQTSSEFKVVDAGLIKDNKFYNIAIKRGINCGGIYYSDKEKKQSLHQKEFLGEFFLIKKPYQKINWTITNEQKKIGDFNCFKAIGKTTEVNHANVKKDYVFTCWFTTEIPVSLGPAGFNDLPGLIVALSKNNITLTLEKVKVTNNKLSIKKPKKGVLLENEKEFEKKGMKLYKKYMSSKN